MTRELNFVNFHVYEGNKVAYLAAQKIVEFPGELFNPLYIYAGTGLGKTHLLSAIHSELNKNLTIDFFSAKDFEEHLEEGKIFDNPVIVDDLHAISGKYHEQILGIIDSALAIDRQICFSGNAAPRYLKDINDKLLSRLEGGLVCDIMPPKEMVLIDVIKKKSGEAGILLPDEIALELAQISPGSFRTIEGMINRLVAYSSLGNLSLDINSVRMILKEFYPRGIYSPVSSLLEELKKNASEVLQDVSEKLNVREEYKQKIYIWEMKGFDTSFLKPLLDGDIELLKKEYDDFIKKVGRLIELQGEFGALDTSSFPDEAMKIESMLFSPECVDEIDELVAKIRKDVVVEERAPESEVLKKEDVKVIPLGFPEEKSKPGEVVEKEEAEVVPLNLPGEQPEPEPEVLKKEDVEVVPLGLPGEEAELKVEAAKVSEEEAVPIPLGPPGEDAKQGEELEAKEEAGIVDVPDSEKLDEEKTAGAKGELPTPFKEEKYIVKEISGELIEDNY